MNLRQLLFTAIVATVFGSVGSVRIDHDKVQPFAQPKPVTASEKAAVKFKPSLTIVENCHPYPAVNAAGETSGGLKPTGKADGDCKGSGLGSQVYGRAAWNNGLWAIMYTWYFPKDQGSGDVGLVPRNERHKWISAVVWINNPAVENPKIIAVSTMGVNGTVRVQGGQHPPAPGRGQQQPPLQNGNDAEKKIDRQCHTAGFL
ncbi:necrosis inducing-like protein NPP1 type [Phytophthora cinnamomi]|uniref:necrosis inducing-like protein NPP1 type n=1 Tax=Phytophthora cinnamomi TaxID=4785 RepID=UPI003559D870|nr:necrosis inducing-like protein NPP1 type [Phytophthora cinnamomi]